MMELISIICNDFIQIGNRNTKTFPWKRVLAKHRYEEFAETELHCLCYFKGKWEKQHWMGLPLDKSYQNPSNRCFTIEEYFSHPVPPGTQAPRSPFHLPAILSLQLPIPGHKTAGRSGKAQGQRFVMRADPVLF